MKGVESMSNDPKDAVVDLSKLMKGWQNSNLSEVQNQIIFNTSDDYLITSCNESSKSLMGCETFALKKSDKKEKTEGMKKSL